MGITGLIPFLEKSSRKTNISEFSGGTVAIDTYCWLHKGAFSCADKIIMGQPTDAYVKYCMKFVNMLLSMNIKPILVFDGRHLPAKAETEIKRRESREVNRKRAAELIKMGKHYEGKNLLRRSLDVSHKMALEVIKECQARNIDCIVAPYEADAQMAYLNVSGIADVVITEDSDLTLFGCKKIFFKMDLYGNGVLVEQDRLYLSMGLKPSDFNIEKFRHMCILSGCDYLASLPGIGLNKACKFIVKNSDDDIYNALIRLASTLNMKSLAVTKEYRDNFMQALITFKHQLVYCPLQRKQVRLNPPTENVTEEQLIHAGSEVDPELAWQLALGNCDPFTSKKLHEFDPDQPKQILTNAWSETPVAKHDSIWSKTYKIKSTETKKANSTPKRESPRKLMNRIASTKGQVVIMKTDILKKEMTPKKRSFEECDVSMEEIVQMYKKPDVDKPAATKSVVEKIEPEVVSSPNEPVSPVFTKRSNPFKKVDNPNETSPSLLFDKTKRRLAYKSRFKKTVIDHTAVRQSEFFSSDAKSSTGENNAGKKDVEKEEEYMDSAESMVTHIDSKDCKENIEFVILSEGESNAREMNSGNNDVEKEEEYMDSVESMVTQVDSKDCKENVALAEKVFISETETSDDDEVVADMQDVNKDSGYNKSKDDKGSDNLAVNCDDSINKKQPFHLVDNNLVKKNSIYEFSREAKKKENENFFSENEEDKQFTVTREIFSEYKSSSFTYDSPDNRLKRDSSFQRSQKSPRSMQRSSSRIVKSNSKKTVPIKGQQSLLSMFGHTKKNSLQH